MEAHFMDCGPRRNCAPCAPIEKPGDLSRLLKLRDISRALRVWTLLAALCCAWLGTTGQAVAQNYQRYFPRVPESIEGEATLPEIPEEAVGDAAVLVDDMKGIVFLEHPDHVATSQTPMEGIHIQGESLAWLEHEEFLSIVRPYLHGPISLRRLNELTREIVLFYRDRDRPVVDVSVPVQDVTDGVVQVVIVEARVGKVRIENACFFDPCWMAWQPCISTGDLIHESVLLEDLRWLNVNPFREVDMELTPGEEFGETDVVFKVRDRRPIQFYTGYEDTGTRQTKLERLLFGFSHGNMFNKDQTLAYQYTASPDFNDLTAHSALYSIPLANRDYLNFWGSFADTHSATDPFDATGRAWQVSGRYQYNLCEGECWQHYFTTGADFKETNTNLDFGGDEVFDSSAQIVQFMGGYHYYKQDGLGTFAYGGDVFFSPGDLASLNDDEAFDVIRADATADYIYTRGYIERQRYLRSGRSVLVRMIGQLSDANLLPSETLGFGGYNSVRGYDMRVVNADSGYIFNFELWSRPVSPGWAHCGEPDELQWLAFYDLGVGYNHTLLPGEASKIDMNSAGVGVRYAAGNNIALRADYGWQLNQIEQMPWSDSRAHIGFVLSR